MPHDTNLRTIYIYKYLYGHDFVCTVREEYAGSMLRDSEMNYLVAGYKPAVRSIKKFKMLFNI